ncbi:MAG TPA: zf-HC2 domain-containing protein [Pyrinomonadaceae bacterium]|nr:zf-HC2 domain-containing protein [Pyrinomonadaceae bacterium]
MANGQNNRLRRAVWHWLLRRLPACREVVQLLSRSMESRLSLRERVLLRLHLRACASCERYLQHLRLMRDALRLRATRDAETKSPSTLSNEARERIRRALEGRHQ